MSELLGRVSESEEVMANAGIAVQVDVLNLEPVKKLHEAVCQAVALLNRAPELARSTEGREAHNLLRQALVDVADAYMDAPVSEHERALVARKHQRKPLTTQQIWTAVEEGIVGGIGFPSKAVAVARAIERAHGIGDE